MLAKALGVCYDSALNLRKEMEKALEIRDANGSRKYVCECVGRCAQTQVPSSDSTPAPPSLPPY